MAGEDVPPLARWRLILGEPAEASTGRLEGRAAAMDRALSWLYGRKVPGAGAGSGAGDTRQGGIGPAQLTVPEWINDVHTLFPQETIERLEQDAIDRYQITEVVTDPKVLERVQPNEALLQAVLRTKHLMNPEVLAMARRLVAEVVRQLMERLAREIRRAFGGTLDRRRRSPFRSARNLDFRGTLRQNLRRYDREQRRICIERPLFHARTRRHTEKWQIILLVDQSGSMLGSTIHAAITAACLWGLPGMRTHLVAFDTEVVDLSDDMSDPVETLMKVQLGGGTDICKAVQYGRDLIDAPRRAIVVIISDFYEGASPDQLVREVAALCAQGTQVLGLGALDEQAHPALDREMAQRLVNAGAQIGVMTPGQLAAWIAERVR